MAAKNRDHYNINRWCNSSLEKIKGIPVYTTWISTKSRRTSLSPKSIPNGFMDSKIILKTRRSLGDTISESESGQTPLSQNSKFSYFNKLRADAEVVNLLIYKRVEIKSVQASYIFYICKWLTHCDLIHYKPHLPNWQQWLNAKIAIISRLSKQYPNFNIPNHVPHRTKPAKISLSWISTIITPILW